ncbi:NeuD/PglB/VioB family sugar acetyltransferase [Salinispirillum marinum]|uniref:NeuD/PglB/VioB family sugar acetyltransferase n=2 Tax=Saccharospirillaceae TaxID=255527 RepID=A0ABV8BG52_9GAMM
MKSNWYIYGAGGLGVETLDILRSYLNDESDFTINFLVDNIDAKVVNGVDVVEYSSNLEGYVTIAIGEPATRLKLYNKIKEEKSSKLELKTIISKDAFVSEFATVGEGCIIAPFCSIQSTALIGNNVAINTAAIVGHDVVVGESAVISSQVNIGGGVKVGRESYIGMGALIREGINIGSNVIVGMGSVVHRDIPDGVIAMGNPARPLKNNVEQKVFN